MTARRRRSCLTVPADDERKLARAAGIDVDEVILDLEDAVAPERKEGARETLARALRDHDWLAATVPVRVNRGSADDPALVAEVRPHGIGLPKGEAPEGLPRLPVPPPAPVRTAPGPGRRA